MSHTVITPAKTISSKVASFFERFIYGGRWVIAPMYVGLLAGLIVYTANFVRELSHLVLHGFTMNETDLMLGVLGAIDSVMVGNLTLFIMVGSYSIFVRKLRMPADDQPRWLANITSGSLKTKMSTSLVGVSSVHLLRDFIDPAKIAPNVLYSHIGIHLVFLVSTLVLAFTDRISHTTPESSPHS